MQSSSSSSTRVRFIVDDTWAAGVLLVADGPFGERLLLLGRDSGAKSGGWSDFAGGRESCDTDPVATAIRELEEETSGVVRMTRAELERSLLKTFRDVTPGGRAITRYLVAAEYDARLPTRFDPLRCHGGEKTALGWFDVADLPRLRRVFGDQMRREGKEIANMKLDVPKFSCAKSPR
jgi:8-oxo-dGTP pyrophosphatase MutT (NUDIX family)